MDPCDSSPCKERGICHSNSTDVWCTCKFPTEGRLCTEGKYKEMVVGRDDGDGDGDVGDNDYFSFSSSLRLPV